MMLKNPIYSFYLIFGVVGILFVFLVWPFWQLLAVSAVLSVMFHPVYLKLKKKLKTDSLSAFATIIIMAVSVMLPIWVLGGFLFAEIANFISDIKNGSFLDYEILSKTFSPRYADIILNFLRNINSYLMQIFSSAFGFITNLISNIASFIFAMFFVIFTGFYFLKESENIRSIANDVSPLSKDDENVLTDKLMESISAVVKGSFLIALIQGLVATVGFVVFGVGSPFLWGALTVFAALIPTIGTALIFIPAVLFQFILGNHGAALGLLLWGSLAVGLIDNFIGPKLLGSKTNLHPLLVLISILGGIQIFGFLGFLFGPIVLAIFVTFFDIYRRGQKN